MAAVALCNDAFGWSFSKCCRFFGVSSSLVHEVCRVQLFRRRPHGLCELSSKDIDASFIELLNTKVSKPVTLEMDESKRGVSPSDARH